MKRLLTGIAFLLVLMMVAVWAWRSQRSDTLRSEVSDFAWSDTASLTRITMKGEGGEFIDLHRQADESWTVNNNYTARPDAVRVLLQTVAKVSVKSPVSQQAMNTVLKNIISSHTLIDLYTGGGDPVKSYYVGGPDDSHTGTFMLMKGSSRPFITHLEGFHGYLSTRYFTNEKEWRHRAVFEYDQDEIASVKLQFLQSAKSNFSITRQPSGDFECAFGSTLAPADYDTLLLHAYLSNYAMVHFDSYEETKEQPFIDSVLASPPMFTLDLGLSNGETRSVHGFYKPMKGGYDLENNPIKNDLDRLYISVDGRDFYVAQYAIFDKLTQPQFFLKSR